MLKTKVIIVCTFRDRYLVKCMEVVQDKVGAEQVADGKVFVGNLEDTIRISKNVSSVVLIK